MTSALGTVHALIIQIAFDHGTVTHEFFKGKLKFNFSLKELVGTKSVYKKLRDSSSLKIIK